MPKKLLYILLIVCFSFVFAHAQKILSHEAGVMVTSVGKLELTHNSKGTRLGYASWMNDDGKTANAIKKVYSNKWEDIKFAVTITEAGKVTITLRSNFARDENGNILQNRTVFKNLKVNGKEIGGKKFSSPKGVPATFAKKIIVQFDAQKGEKLDICVSAKALEKWEDTSTLDISKHANISTATPPKDLAAFKNLPKGDVELAGMKLKFIDAEKNNGKNVVSVSDKKPFVLDLKGKGIRGKHLYLAAACSDEIGYTDKACAYINVIFSDGSSQYLWIRKGRDIANSKDAPKPHGKTTPIFVDDKENNTGVVYISEFDIGHDDLDIDSLHFGGDSLYVFAVTVSNEDVETMTPFEFDLSQWKAVDTSDLEIKEGSALDVSEGIGKDKAGRYGKIKIGKNGNFEFEKMPNRKIKFKGTNWRPGDMFGNSVKTHEDIDKLAKMMRKQGYNLVRWRISMRKDEFDAPYRLKEYNKDMYDYFLYAMAREGIYSHLNLSSHDLGNPKFVWDDRTDVKILMFFGDEQTREDWRRLVHMQLNLVNRYTGKKWKDDPSIVTTEYFNEIELGPVAIRGASPDVKKFADRKFIEYLKRNYKSFDDWNEPNWKRMKNLKSFDDVRFSESAFFESGTSHADVGRFIIEHGRDMQRFCEKVVREEVGFKVPLHQHNVVRSTAFSFLSAEAGDYTALNVYHMHPRGGLMDKGSIVGSDSSIKDQGSYFRAAAAKRVANRPMMLSEWQHCHWNPYKHEAGILFPAYSALQGFDNLTVHDIAVNPPRNILGNFEVSNSPVFRANEFLSYVLFYRGDVKTSSNRVDVVYEKEYIEKSEQIGNAMNSEQSKIALMTGFAVEYPSARKTPIAGNIKPTPANIRIEPIGSTKTWSEMNFSSTGEGDAKFDINAMADRLRSKGILPKDNISNPKDGVFQSDTGEITMRVNDELIKVVTANTEAVALKNHTKNENLDLLTVNSVSVPAAVAITSVDNKPLANSERMVIIFNTDNISSGFKITHDREFLISAGAAPVLMQVGKVSLRFKLPQSNKRLIDKIMGLFGKEKPKSAYVLYALKINGERLEKIPFVIKDGTMHIDIDTSKLKDFSPFFELVAE